MEHSSANYRYQPLAYIDSIRLLELHPGAPGSALSCSLIEVRRADHPVYEALSYTWGEPVFPREIGETHSNTVMPITENLYDALQALRSEVHVRKLWVDAICIHQTDVREKSHQVADMGDVYRNATGVLIWLGKQDATTAMQNLEQIGEEYRSYGITDLSFPDFEKYVDLERYRSLVFDYNLTAIEDFYKKEWFERVWTLQECVLARKMTFHASSGTIDHMLLRRATSVLIRLSTFGPLRCLDILNRYAKPEVSSKWSTYLYRAWYRFALHEKHNPTTGFAQSPHEGSEEPKGASASGYHQSSSEQPRATPNRKSALYGVFDTLKRISSWGYQANQTPIDAAPDRALALDGLFDIFKRITTSGYKCSDERDKVYAILGLARDTMAIVPDYSLSSYEVLLDLSMKHVLAGDFSILDRAGLRTLNDPRASNLPSFHLNQNPGWRPISEMFPHDFPFLASKDPHAVRKIDSYSFEIRGKRIDRSLHSIDFVTKLGDGINRTDYRRRLYAAYSAIPELISALGRLQDLGTHWKQSFAQHEFGDAALYRGRRGGTYRALFSTLSMGTILVEDMERAVFAPEELPEKKIRDIAYMVAYFMSGRVLFLTDNGCVGAGPETMQAGDHVVIFDGAKTPFVLREVKAGGGRWKLVGECYLHGWMNAGSCGPNAVAGQGGGRLRDEVVNESAGGRKHAAMKRSMKEAIRRWTCILSKQKRRARNREMFIIC